jgi:hypothetical protein
VDEDLLMAAMNGSDGVRIRQAILVNGVDALGWYVSFHARGAQWGIYVPMSGIAYLMKHGFSDLSADPITKLRIAFRAIHQHELSLRRRLYGGAMGIDFGKTLLCAGTAAPRRPVRV